MPEGLLTLFVGSMLISTSALGQGSDSLSLGAALARAARFHPAAVAASWEARSRAADAMGSAAAFLPQLRTELNAVRTDDPVAVFGTKLRQGNFAESDLAIAALNFPAPVTDVSAMVAVEQPLFQPMALSARKAARAGAEASRLNQERTFQMVAFETIRAYFGARLAADRSVVLNQALEAARGTLGQVSRLRGEGVVTVVDEQLARTRVGELEAALAASRAAEIAASDLLLRLIGADPGAALVLTDSLTLPDESPADSGARPDLAALRAQLVAQDADVTRARSQWLPSLAAFGNLSWHDREFGGPRHWTAGLVLQWTPFAGLSDVGALRRAIADREAARARLANAEQVAHAELRSAAAERAAALAAYRASEAALGQGALAVRAASSRYQEGASTISELLAVRAAESGQRLARLEALFRARVADAALVLALGGTPR